MPVHPVQFFWRELLYLVGRVHGFTTQRPVTSHNSAATMKTSTFTSSEGTRPYTGPITTKITESSPSSSDVVTSAKSTSQYTRTTRATGATKLSTRIPKTSPTAASTPAKTHDPTDDPRPDPTRAPTPAPTHDPGSVPTRASTPALSTAPVTTTARLTTKRPVKTSTKTSRSTTRTTRSTTRRSTTTMIWEPYTNIHCVFAADMLNMAKDEVAYEKEEDLIIKISEALFNSSIRPSAGLWIYGYTRVSRNWKYVFMNMKSAFNLFWEYVLARMRISDPAAITENKEVVAVTNKAFDLTRKATCLVFFSAVKNGTDFPLLKPRYPYKRVVAVSLQGADLSKSVSHLGQRGVAVNVPLYNFSRKDVSNVVESIRSAFS
ncbi:hypothetical protein OESDEN_04102 [Oesophagostomum dentatum]|uniref:Uncharacterized protein n=1 Tax=Oesophagostomum dentatum TaxID=61180 RepID=A0A0B1TEF0_OESDE|nr:hypothetical protein OESDEN_04102 [Oesophagostomum dentatum]